MRRFAAVTLLLVLVASACWGAKSASRAKAEDDIREAVFRHHMHRFAGEWRDVKVHFLSVNGKDPSKMLMARFARHRPPVRPVSRSAYRDVASGVRDKKTGDRGLIFSADGIKWLSKTKVQVEGGYFAHGRTASRNTCTLELRKGRWMVTREGSYAFS